MGGDDSEKISCLTAPKFQFGSKPCSMDCVIAQEQIISAMSTVFHWTPGQHKWVLDSIDILWTLSRGAKPTGNKKNIHDYIGRKAKIMGLLPFGLFPGVRLEEKWSHPGTSVYTKEVLNSKDFDFRKIVIEVISSGSADASLMALKKINTFQGLVSNAEDSSRHERMQLWQTYLTKSDDCLSDAFMSI